MYLARQVDIMRERIRQMEIENKDARKREQERLQQQRLQEAAEKQRAENERLQAKIARLEAKENARKQRNSQRRELKKQKNQAFQQALIGDCKIKRRQRLENLDDFQSSQMESQSVSLSQPLTNHSNNNAKK